MKTSCSRWEKNISDDIWDANIVSKTATYCAEMLLKRKLNKGIT